VSIDPPGTVTEEQAAPAAAPPAARPPLRRLLPYLRPHRLVLTVVALVSLVGAAIALAQPLLVSAVISAVQEGRPVRGPVVVLVALLVTGAAAGALQTYLLQRTAEGVVLGTRRALVGRLLRLPVAEIDRRRVGDLMSRVGADTTLLRSVVTSGVVDLASSSIVVVGAVVAMALVDPVLLAAALGCVSISLVAVVLVSRRIQQVTVVAQTRVGEMSASVERALSAVRTIRASGATEREAQHVGQSARAAYDAGVRAARLEAAVSPAGTLAVQGAFIAVLGIGGARVAAGAVDVADLVAFILYLFLLALPLAQLLRTWTTLQAGLAALVRIEEVSTLPPEDEGPVVPPARVSGAAAALELRDVDFSYPDGTPVLLGVSFTVPRGTRCALVGPSGAGKSTVLALVERFYDVDAGAVLVDGHDVRDLPRTALRAGLGYVEQEAPVLAGTLRDNLLLAAPDAREDEIDAVLAAVNLTSVARRSPLGLGAQVGDGGVLLSGGERQRLAIARSLLARPALLLLDEPTASLDARNERALREAVETVAVDRTVLVVAHRLSTVVTSDQIVVLDQGRVVGRGTHAELVGSSDLYRDLASSQLLH
jgi:ABC-type multidrug transport system fused ATPase/permease subunit